MAEQYISQSMVLMAIKRPIGTVVALAIAAAVGGGIRREPEPVWARVVEA